MSKAKLKEKAQAISLRRQGYSINEIYKKLGVSKGSVSSWVSHITLSENAQQKIKDKKRKGREKAYKIKKLNTNHKKANIKKNSQKIVDSLSETKTSKKVLCSLIYWCEGASDLDGKVDFTNSDPELIKTFLTLLRSVYDIDESKFRVLMHLHSYHNEEKQKQFWSNVTGMSKNQFLKTYQKRNTQTRKKEDYEGCISVRYHDVDLQRQLVTLARVYMENTGRVR